jgi:hypothetical protein
MSVIAISFAAGRSAGSTMHPADAKATHRWSLARLPCRLRSGATSRSSVALVHGVVAHFLFVPPPTGIVSFWLDSMICIVLSAPAASRGVSLLAVLPVMMLSAITA